MSNLELSRTGLLIMDPQNDFLPPGGVFHDAVKSGGLEDNEVVQRLVQLREAAREARIRVFYSPHNYTDDESANWKHLDVVGRMMFDVRMFRKGSWGAEFHPQLEPDNNTFVLAPHKALSGFWTNDVNAQLRQRDIDTIILAGMSANLCVESHLRDSLES